MCGATWRGDGLVGGCRGSGGWMLAGSESGLIEGGWVGDVDSR
jgi:hypothetical protein